jgi:hypothetical protein
VATVPLLLGLARGSDTRFAARWPRSTWALPLVLALELSAAALVGHLYEGGTVASGIEPPEQANLAWGPLRRPVLSASEYVRPTRFVEEIRGQDGRYLTWVPPAAFYKKGYLFNQGPEDWPALENMRGTLFQIPDALGYSPVQLPRYWSYIRATNADRVPDIFYNAAVLNEPTLSDLRLLGVRYLIARRDILPRVPGRPVAADGRFVLWEIRGYERRVSVVPTWYDVPDAGVALLSVLQESFDPKEQAVLEEDPGIERAGRRARAGTASYQEESPENIVIEAEARTPSMVVIRNTWDRNWTATVDGAPAEVLRADHFLQAVAVGRGHHQIRLTYRDPAIGRGLMLSGLAWGALLVSLLAGSIVAGIRRRRPPATSS